MFLSRPGFSYNTHPLIGHQLVAGPCRVNAVKQPVFGGHAFGGLIENLLEAHHRELVLFAQSRDDRLDFPDGSIPLRPLLLIGFLAAFLVLAGMN